MRYKYITKIENKFDKKKTPEGLLSKIKKCLSNSRGVGDYAYQRKDGVCVVPIGCLKP